MSEGIANMHHIQKDVPGSRKKVFKKKKKQEPNKLQITLI